MVFKLIYMFRQGWLKALIAPVILMTLIPAGAFAQSAKGRVIRSAIVPKDGFPFSREWAYPWYVNRRENGSFEHAMGETITAEDTAHLYYTAGCETNVQGVYPIHYCYARYEKDTLKLVFEDGMPAYASSFEVAVQGDSFAVRPHLVYPSPGTVQIEKVTQQQLTLNSNGEHKYTGGYIYYEFLLAGSDEKYYLRGFFNTPLQAALNRDQE